MDNPMTQSERIDFWNSADKAKERVLHYAEIGKAFCDALKDAPCDGEDGPMCEVCAFGDACKVRMGGAS